MADTEGRRAALVIEEAGAVEFHAVAARIVEQEAFDFRHNLANAFAASSAFFGIWRMWR